MAAGQPSRKADSVDRLNSTLFTADNIRTIAVLFEFWIKLFPFLISIQISYCFEF